MFRRIPLTVKMLITTILVGFAVWYVLDNSYVHTLKEIFQQSLTERLDHEAFENRKNFDSYVKLFHHSVKMFTSQKRLIDYVEERAKKEWAKEGPVLVKSYDRPPPWYPRASVARTFAQTRYVLLLDGRGMTREFFAFKAEAPPESLIKPTKLLRQLSHNQSFMTVFEGVPYLLTADSLLDSRNELIGTLMFASPIDEQFLYSSQGFAASERIVALLTGEDPEILASNRSDLLQPGTKISSVQDRYLVTGKTFFDYGSSELLLQFVSLIPTAEIESLTRSIVSKNRRQYGIAALAFIISFSAIMFMIARRISRLTGRVEDLSQEMLGVKHGKFVKGDKIYQLEERFEVLTKDLQQSRKELQETYEKLIRSEKLSTIGQLAGSVGHDLRNPLAVIRNSVYYLNMKLGDANEKVKKHIALLEDQVRRSDNIVSDLMDFAVAREPDFVEADLNRIVKDALASLDKPNAVTVETSLNPDVSSIQADPDQVRRAFQNLVSNAYQAMLEGGLLRIMTSAVNGYVEIDFVDNGEGIQDVNLERIFEPLVTTRPHGIGLGLPIVKGIIEGHHGSVEVKSEVGKGTTFIVKLPLMK
jgi:signal transduction histidine kinase